VGKRVAAVALGLAVALLVGEVLVRFLDLEERWLPSLTYYQSVDIPVHRHSEDPELSYELAPGRSGSFRKQTDEPWGADPREVSVNQLGYRDVERSESKPEGTYRVLAAGGSNTYGAAVSNPDAWPAALERHLQASSERPVEVWNLGVSGYVTRQKVAAARKALKYQPDLILFELANTGPRNLLLTPGLDVRDRYALDPGLYHDSLHHSPRPGTLGWLAFRNSALVQGGVLWADRRLRRIQPGRNAPPLESLDSRAERDAAQRFGDFLAELKSGHPGVEVAIVHSAEGGGAAWIEELPLWVLDLHSAPNKPELPDAMHIHPGKAVYDWYGATLSGALEQAGCLEGDCSWERGKLSWVYPASEPPPG